ncbi:MAG: extracellular solute-binding protein [Actinomycetota bacterium]
MALALVVAACSSDTTTDTEGGTSDDDTATAEPYTFNYTSFFWEGPEGPWLQDRVAEFEAAYPHITVNDTYITGGDYENQILTQMAGGSAPDLFTPFTNMLAPLLADGLLAPLDACFEGTDIMDRILPSVSAAQRDGVTYGVPATMSPQSLIYNQQLLDAAGVEVPTTPEELLEASRAVKEKTGKFGYAFTTDTATAIFPYIVSMQWVLGYDSDWSQPDGTITANAPKTIEAVETLMQFYDEDLTPRGLDAPSTRALFAEGEVAFLIDGPWVLAQIKADVPDLYPSIGFAVSPTPTHAAITGGAFYAIPVDAPNYDDACELLKLHLGQDVQKLWLEDLVSIPAVKVLPGDEFLAENPWVETMVEVAAEYPGGFGYAPPGYEVDAAAFRQIVVNNLSTVLAGDTSVEDALNQAQEDLEAEFGG